jgi:cell division protein FtsZ
MLDEMSEITEFMSKMENDDLETKWGTSYDPSLKDRIKVTLLASGFGMEDIDSTEMKEHIEAKKEADMIREQEKKARREQIYGSDDQTGYVHQNVYYYIFKDQDLDNDNLISSVVSLPTYKRPKKKLDQLEAISLGIEAEEMNN